MPKTKKHHRDYSDRREKVYRELWPDFNKRILEETRGRNFKKPENIKFQKEGLTIKGIAKETGFPLDTVKLDISRLRKELRTSEYEKDLQRIKNKLISKITEKYIKHENILQVQAELIENKDGLWEKLRNYEMSDRNSKYVQKLHDAYHHSSMRLTHAHKNKNKKKAALLLNTINFSELIRMSLEPENITSEDVKMIVFQLRNLIEILDVIHYLKEKP